MVAGERLEPVPKNELWIKKWAMQVWDDISTSQCTSLLSDGSNLSCLSILNLELTSIYIISWIKKLILTSSCTNRMSWKSTGLAIQYKNLKQPIPTPESSNPQKQAWTSRNCNRGSSSNFYKEESHDTHQLSQIPGGSATELSSSGQSLASDSSTISWKKQGKSSLKVNKWSNHANWFFIVLL